MALDARFEDGSAVGKTVRRHAARSASATDLAAHQVGEELFRFLPGRHTKLPRRRAVLRPERAVETTEVAESAAVGKR